MYRDLNHALYIKQWSIYFKVMDDSWKLEQNAKFLVDQS